MTLSKIFFSLQGRINRARFFWYSILITVIAVLITSGLSIALPKHTLVISAICGILFIYPNLALLIKRFHDMDTSGTRFIPIYVAYAIINILIMIYPEMMIFTYIFYTLVVVVAVMALILIFKEGTIGGNKYGEDLIIRNTEVSVTKNKTKRKWGRVLALSIPGLLVLWIIVSIVFGVLGTVIADPTQVTETGSLLLIIKTFVNRFLGLLGLISIPATIFGIVMLTKNKKNK